MKPEQPNQLQVIYGLMRYWEDRPHLRLCQIVSNAFRIHPKYRRNPEPEINDIFYMEDHEFLEALELLKQNESQSKRTTQE